MVFYSTRFRIVVFFLCLQAFFVLPLYSMGKTEKEKKPSAPVQKEPVQPPKPVEKVKTMLVGTDEGLFALDGLGRTELWTGGSVKKILFISGAADDGSAKNVWVILSSEGVLVSRDLKEWEKRNRGLPVKTIKIFQDGNKSFLPMVQEIKDLEINPADPRIMACATKDRVYLSRNGGMDWEDLGAPQYRTNGIKAVACVFLPGANSGNDLTVFLSHSIYGVFYIQPDRRSGWIELSRGIETLETTDNADEVSDIAVAPISATGGTYAVPEIYISQTFRRRIYRLDWRGKKFDLVWADESPFGTVDSLCVNKDGLSFIYEGTVASVDRNGSSLRKRQDIFESVQKAAQKALPNCIVIPENENLGEGEMTVLSELWLLWEQEPGAAPKPSPMLDKFPHYAKQALNKEGLYFPVNHAIDRLKTYLDTIEKGGLNMIVLDMKDDYGRLRFTPENKAISEKGRVFRPLDIDSFLKDMKERGIYTVARIVVFKDPVLAAKENNRYAVWDSRNAMPWRGYHDSRQKKSTISDVDRRNELLRFFPANDPDYEVVRTFYDESWVDPYSEVVWEYTAALAVELHGRGFDEIQFDYIRFPTDGQNLGDARYRWQDSGMDKESAILSFLRHIRSKVKAPISIDIYGANGWYRTGARTGQEVEMLVPWVDVICPMYYPSHFEQHFLAQNPPELRPWRIYYHGTLRTARIGRGQAIIRPYAQAFSLNVSYDRRYYNLDYVLRQVEGVRAAGNGGLTYWNNSGRYGDIPAKLRTGD